MARPSRLAAIAKSKGVTIDELIKDAIHREGSVFRAALAIGVSPNSLHHWMKVNEVKLETTVRLVKQDDSL